MCVYMHHADVIMASQFPNQMPQGSVGPPPGLYGQGSRDGNSTELSSFFGPPSSANDNPFSSFGSDGPTTMNPPEKYPPQSEMSFSHATSSQHVQLLDTSSVNPDTSQAANIGSFFSHTAAGLFGGGEDVANEEPDDLFSSSSLHLQSDPPPHFPSPSHPPLDLSMSHVPAVNPATGAASSSMLLEESSSLLQPLSPTSVNPIGHSLEHNVLPLSTQGHGQVPNKVENLTSELFNDDGLQPDDFLSFVKQPQSLPVRLTSVVGQASVQGHAPPPPHNAIGKSTSTPSTSLINTASLPGSLQQGNASLTDAMLSDMQQSFHVESGGGGRAEPGFLQKGGPITADSNPLATGTDVCGHSINSSSIPSPISHSLSNADKNIGAVPYGDQTFTYQNRTNADPEFNPTNPRGVQKGPLTNLEMDANVAGKLATGSPQEFGMVPLHDPLPASSGTNVSERFASVYMTSGSADVQEKGSSLSSSLNQSLCSLMDNQDDLAVRISPVRLMPPVPFMHETFPSGGPPLTVREISVEKFSDVALLPSTSLSSTVRSTRCEQAVAAVSGSHHSNSGNNDPAVHRPPVSSNSFTSLAHHGIQEFVGVQNSSCLGNYEKWNGSMASREAENQSLVTMTRLDGSTRCARTDASTAATLVGGSAAITLSMAQNEQPDSLEDWELVEKASNSTAGSASDVPLMLQALSSGAVMTSTDQYGPLPAAVFSSRSVLVDEQGCRPLVPHPQQPCPSVSSAPLDTLLKLHTQPAFVSIPPGYASFPSQPLLTATSVFSSQTVAPGLLLTASVGSTSCSDTPTVSAGGTSNVSSVLHSVQALSTGLELTSHRSESSVGPSSSLSGLPASAVPLLKPTSYSSDSKLEPTSYFSGSNLEPTSYSSDSKLEPTSYFFGSNLEPTSYSSVSNFEPTSSSCRNWVPATPSSSGPILEATLPPTRTATCDGRSCDQNPPPQADTGQQRDHIISSVLAPPLSPTITTRVTAINPLQRTSLGQVPQSSFLGHPPVAPQLNGSGVVGNELNASQLNRHHLPSVAPQLTGSGGGSGGNELNASQLNRHHLPSVAPQLTGSGGGSGGNQLNASQLNRHHLAPVAPQLTGSGGGSGGNELNASQLNRHHLPPVAPQLTGSGGGSGGNELNASQLNRHHLPPVAPQLTGSGGGSGGNELNDDHLSKSHLAPARSRPITTAPEISEHLKEGHTLSVGVMASQRTRDPQVAKPVAATEQPDTCDSAVGVPMSSSAATSGINPQSELPSLGNKTKPSKSVLESALTTAPLLPQSTLPIQPEIHVPTSTHLHDLTGLATGDGTAGEIPPPTTVLESNLKNEKSASVLRPVATADVPPASDVSPRSQDNMATGPALNSMEQDVRLIQTQQDEARVRQAAGVLDNYAPTYHGDYNPAYDIGGGEGGYAYDDRYRLGLPYPDHMYQPRPHSRAGYSVPDYGYHQASLPSHPSHHQDYRGYYSGQHGYNTPYANPYQQPPDPYYNSYRQEYHSQTQMYQAYDPGYGYPPQHYGHPSYRTDPQYAPQDVYNDGQYRTDDPYSDEYYRQQQQQCLHAQQPSSEQPLETDNPIEPSMIQGGHADGVFEISDVYNSPSIPVPTHPNMPPPLESTCLEQPGNPLQWDGAQCSDDPYPLSNTQYYRDGVAGGYLPPVASEGHLVGQTMQNQEDDKQRDPIPTTPPSPKRRTPEHYYCSHVRTAFCFGGKLVTVLPNSIRMLGKAMVEIQSVRDVLVDGESRRFIEAVTDSCDPFIPGETPKGVVLHFASDKARQCREKKEAMVSSEGHTSDDADSVEALEDEALLWEFLMLLCQQNGVIVPSDVADLLMRGKTLLIKPSMPQDEQECLDYLRQLLLSGRKKNALDYACSKGLWGHALMLASRMDEQSRTYVVNRFTASLASTDPLSTFYTLLLGRIPAAVKQEGLTRAGDWRPHLSMILANKCNKLDTTSIISLGDSLLVRKKLYAAHLCYYLADINFGRYGDSSVRYSLFGIDQSVSKAGRYPWPCELWKMEVLEYALSLTKHDFSLPSFQVFKVLYVLKLVEYGFLMTAVKYCEQISYSLLKGMDKYVPTVISTLLEVAVRLHHLTTEFGMVESELPSWLRQLELSVTAILSTGYTPNLLSPSPAFSSVSQTYSSSDARPQLTIGLQQDNSRLTVPQTHIVCQAQPKEDNATLYMNNRDDRDGGTVEGVEMFRLQTAANSAPGQVLDYNSNALMNAPLGLDGGEGVATGEVRGDFAQTVQPGEVTEVQQYMVLDDLAIGAGEMKELASEQLDGDRSGGELYREQAGVHMNKPNPHDPSLQVQDRGNDGINAVYDYCGTSAPGAVGGSVAGGGMAVEGERIDGGELYGQHHPQSESFNVVDCMHVQINCV